MELVLAGVGPLARQVFVALKRRIASGELPAGTRLPGSRELARKLQVARGTVVSAYRQLEAEGYCETRPRSGTRVSQLPVLTAASAAAGAPQTQRQPLRWRLDSARPELDLRPGLPSAADFPHTAWARLARRELARGAQERFSYPDPEGLPRLRVAVAEHLRQRRGLACSASQVLITQGAQQAFSLIARTLLPVGVPVAVEDPGYPGFSQAAQAAGVDVAPVAVDRYGLVVERLRGMTVSGVCVTPAHQFPTGAILSASRRRELLGWARARDAWIIEDDYDSEYRFDAAPVEPLKQLDGHGRVLLVGSFSKTMFPDLRLGYVVAEAEQLQLLALMKNLDDAGSSTLNQAMLAAFMEDGHYARHLRRSVRAVAQRRRALMAALTHHFGGAVTFQGAAAGLHLVADLGLSTDQERAVVHLAGHRGLGLYAQQSFAREGGRENDAGAGLVLGFARLEAQQFDEAIARLARLVAGLRQRRPGLRRR
ncbi:MAG: PLP-dependent aminotransferase family protein [Pseudomonadales bacterium]